MENKDIRNFSEYIRVLYDHENTKMLREVFSNTEEADIAEAFDSLSLEMSVALFRLVKREKRSEVFSLLSFDRQVELLEKLPDEVVSSFLNQMEPDDRTKLLEDLPVTVRNQVLLRLNPEERRIAWRLLSYPEDSVGRLMTPEFMSVQSHMTVGQALDKIRWNDGIPVRYLHYIFILDEHNRLIGEVELGELVTCDPPSTNIQDVATPSTVFLKPESEASDAVEAFRKYDHNYIPVINEQKEIIGVVTADDVFDVAEEEATEDIHQFGGSAALEDSYFLTPFKTMIVKRAGSLAILFLGMLITGAALKHYDKTLNKFTYLVFFLPIVLSSGGNAGTQAASLILRGLAINEMEPRDWWRVLSREVFIGLTLGLMLAIMGYIRAFSWGYDPYIGVIVALTLVAVVTWGAISGSMLPLLFKTTKLDPAVISSPFISTLIDLTGVLVFINIAIWVIDFLGKS